MLIRSAIGMRKLGDINRWDDRLAAAKTYFGFGGLQ